MFTLVENLFHYPYATLLLLTLLFSNSIFKIKSIGCDNFLALILNPKIVCVDKEGSGKTVV